MFRSDIYLFCLVGAIMLGGSWSEAEVPTNETHLRSCSADHPKSVVKIGIIADNSSRLGREQIVAIYIAFQQHFLFSNSCQKVELLLRDSPDNSAQATATGKIST